MGRRFVKCARMFRSAISKSSRCVQMNKRTYMSQMSRMSQPVYRQTLKVLASIQQTNTLPAVCPKLSEIACNGCSGGKRNPFSVPFNAASINQIGSDDDDGG